jgi:carbon starvation protein CstA
MISLVCALAALALGYIFYGRIVEKTFGPDDRITPACAMEDGVDFVPKRRPVYPAGRFV